MICRKLRFNTTKLPITFGPVERESGARAEKIKRGVGRYLSNQLWKDGRVKNEEMETKTSNWVRKDFERRRSGASCREREISTYPRGLHGISRNRQFFVGKHGFWKRAQAQMFGFVRLLPRFFTIHPVRRWRLFFGGSGRLAGFVPACPGLSQTQVVDVPGKGVFVPRCKCLMSRVVPTQSVDLPRRHVFLRCGT